MDDLFEQTAKDSSLFFSALRRCKCRCASSDKSLSKKPAKPVEIPPKFYSLAGAQDAGLLQIFFHFKIFVFALAICTINVTNRYGFYISHFSLLEMSIIIQKLLLQVTFVLLLVFYLIGQIMGLPSPSELTGGAPKILR